MTEIKLGHSQIRIRKEAAELGQHPRPHMNVTTRGAPAYHGHRMTRPPTRARPLCRSRPCRPPHRVRRARTITSAPAWLALREAVCATQSATAFASIRPDLISSRDRDRHPAGFRTLALPGGGPATNRCRPQPFAQEALPNNPDMADFLPRFEASYPGFHNPNSRRLPRCHI